MDPLEQSLQRVLVLRCQVGDRPALDELYRLYSPRLGYYLRRMLAADDAADVQQEVWLAVLRGLGRLRAADAFSVWLYRVAHSKAMNRLTGGGPPHEPLDDTPGQREAQAPEPDFSPADAARVHASLALLRPEHREVLLLRFMEDLSYEQIAGVIGCAVGTVRSRLH